MLVGAASACLALGWYSIAPTGWYYVIGMPLSSLWSLLIPGLQGLMTRRVAAHEQGQLQGANQSLSESLRLSVRPCSVCRSPGRCHPDYSVPGLPMFLASMTMVVCLSLSVWAGRAHNKQR